MKKSIFILFIIHYSLLIANAQVAQQWAQRYNGPGNGDDIAYSLAVDGSGNVYVTGQTFGSGTNYDYATIKYNSSGVMQWVQTYNGPGNVSDIAYSIAVDGSGNVYVTGYSSQGGTNSDYATIKYNSSGVQQWVQRYNGPGNGVDGAYSIAVDGSGNVYVTGQSYGGGTSLDYATIKYNSSGVQQWVATYNGPGNSADIARSITVDSSGNVYVTGNSAGSGTGLDDYATIKYNSSGVQQWVQRYNGPGNGSDIAYSIALDGSGNVYVTGQSYGGGTSHDYATIKYNSSGVQQWVATYNEPGNGADYAKSIAVDGSGNVYVTGQSMASGTGDDYATIKYNSSGVQQWVQRYNGPGNGFDEAFSIAVDGSGNVYVTGESVGSGTYLDYATIKYSTAGVQQWVQRYNGPGNDFDVALSIAVDGSGNVYVTGRSFASGTSYDYATIKYTQSPNAPSNLTALAVSSSRINLNWTDNSGNETGFKIERSTNAGANWILKDSTAQNIITYADTGLTANRIYHYRIYAYNAAGNSAYSNVAFDTTFDLAPSAPSNLTALAVSSSRINLNWTDNSNNEIGFKIQRSTNAGVNWILKDSVGQNIITYADTGLTANTIYHYRIYAFNAVGNSAYSNVAYDTTFMLSGIIKKESIPDKFALYDNYPNPFNPTTKIKFDVPSNLTLSGAKGLNVKLIIFDILGREVETLVNKELKPGHYEIQWDASNYPSGVYFYKIQAGDFIDTKKTILLK